MSLPNHATCTISVIGLGYVGLPLAIEFSKTLICLRTGENLSRKIIGFDINKQRIDELSNKFDFTNEIPREDLNQLKNIELTNKESSLAHSDIYIVTVPTPLGISNKPDLNPIIKATELVGRSIQNRKELVEQGIINSAPIVIYESTVYPGLTEEVCIPILEKESGLVLNNTNYKKSFLCGYSPERINPGDKKRRLKDIIKVTSGSSSEAAAWIDKLYGSIIQAGTYLAPSIKVAEAAKVIENTQRDINIALVNELSIIFRSINIDTLDVLSAAETKWNFLPFKPGLVGGHCIGVDPYYLTYKSEMLGYSPQIVLAGRRINDGMSKWIVEQMVLEMAQRGINITKSKVLVLGITFKEDCPDIRNSKTFELIKFVESYSMECTVVDPLCDVEASTNQLGLKVLRDIPSDKKFSSIIISVKHKDFLAKKIDFFNDLLEEDGIILDLKGILPKSSKVIRF